MLYVDYWGNSCELGEGVWATLPNINRPGFAREAAEAGDNLATTELEQALAKEVAQKTQALGAEVVQAADAA